MKKTILAMLLAGSSCAVFAQNDSMNRNNGTMNNNWNNGTMNNASMNGNTLNSNTSYNAYGTFAATPPNYVSGYVLRDYPAATDMHWQQSADWWHGYYMNNGQPTHVYYNSAGQSFNVALPVKENLIPDAVVSKANQMWGPTVYDITTVKGSQGQDIYLVRTIENGQLSSQWMGSDGNKVIDVYRMETSGPMNNGSMNTTTNSTDNTTTTSDQMNTTTTEQSATTDNGSDVSDDAAVKTGKDKLKIKTKTADGKKKVTKVVNGKVTTKGGDQ